MRDESSLANSSYNLFFHWGTHVAWAERGPYYETHVHKEGN